MKRRSRLCTILSRNWYRYSSWILFACWFTGLGVGILTAIHTSDILTTLMRSAVSQPVSISGLMIAVFLPFLFTALAVSVSESWLLPLICGCKAFSFGYCACGVSLTFGQSSWLLQFLLMFSDHLSVPMLYLFCLRNLKGRSAGLSADVLLFGGWCALVVFMDHRFVSPFLVKLFT